MVKQFTKENVSKIKNVIGRYELFDKDMKRIRHGRSTILKHRLQSWIQKDDFNAHPTAKCARDKGIEFFKVVKGRRAWKEEQKLINRANKPVCNIKHKKR